MIHRQEAVIGGRVMSIETGRVAEQANGEVLVRYGDTDIMGIVGASAALSVSDVPFAGPVGAVRVGYIDDQLVINPFESQMPNSRLDLAIAGTSDAVMMVEAGAKELPEEMMLEAVRFGQ